MSKLMLIDGNSLTYRAFFALPTDMATASGQVTNAVFGFTSMLINLVKDQQPDRLVVCFDRPEPTFRHEMTPSYKAQRDETPELLRPQLGLVRDVLTTMAIPKLEMVGYEADDLIATLATQGRDRGDDVVIVTGDRDSFQLVEDPHVRVLYNRRGVSDYALYDEAGIFDRTGVTPRDYVEYAALRGDPSDNLPGVPGVGEKTAAKLINDRGGIDGIYAAIDEYTPKLRENLIANEDNVRNNVTMMRLVCDVDVPEVDANLGWGRGNPDEIKALFETLEFRSLWTRLAPMLGEEPETVTAKPLDPVVDVLATVEAAAKALRTASTGSGVLAVAAPDSGVADGLAFTVDPAEPRVAFIPGPCLSDPAVLAELGELVGPTGRPAAMHGGKSVIRDLLGLGVDLRDLVIDTQIAAYLLDPAEGRYELSELLTRFTGLSIADAGPPAGQLDLAGGADDRVDAAAVAALAVDRLVEPLREAMTTKGLLALHDDLEVPLVRVLARMEHRGIGVDPDVLQRIRDELTEATLTARNRVVELAGHEFNVNSTKQLREVLFDELGLTPHKKTKTGYSTDAQTLEKMRDEHPIVDALLEFREVEKLRSTYGEGLLAEVQADHRIRATFNQTVARTGRLSSDQPNLHNIPVRSERGRVFRTAFVAAPGHRLLIADYDQIELRCIAHLAEDPGLIEAFDAGDDIHTATAARIFDIDPAQVHVEERSKAKMVSYGLAYGMEAYGLAQRLAIPVGEAAIILENYFAAFPKVKDYMEVTVAEARDRGYTETLFGRRRQIPELSSDNRQIRQAGERQAMNAGIQGLAADIFKVALVRLDAALEDAAFESRIVLQVHDEIIVEAPESEIDQVSGLMEEVMANAFDLRVPLLIDLKVAQSWADAKG